MVHVEDRDLDLWNAGGFKGFFVDEMIWWGEKILYDIIYTTNQNINPLCYPQT